jgi:ABC-type uncharacterized transport system permease subunit
MSGAAAPQRLRAGLASAKLPAISAAAAFLACVAAVAASGHSPLTAGSALWAGSFGSRDAFGRTLVAATPLIFTGLAAAFSFKAGLFNVGAEGQLYLGALTAAWLGVALPFTGPVAVVVILLAGSAAGGLWGAIPGYLRARADASEIVTTLMLNFVAVSFTSWAVLNLLNSADGYPTTRAILPANRLPLLHNSLGRAHWGIAVAVVVAALVYLIFQRTSWGYELRVTGLAPRCANYAGIRVRRNMALTLSVSGAIAGLGGAVEILGLYGNMVIPWEVGLGFTGIAVALIGRLNPWGCILGALLLGALSAGGQQMEFDANVPRDLVQLLTGLLLLFVTISRIPPHLRGQMLLHLRGLGRKRDREPLRPGDERA